MESNYRHSDFERYLKDNADQYRMFPSEKVWKGIHNNLHTRRKWYGIGLAFLLLLTGGAVTWVMTTYPVSKKENVPAPEAGLIAKQAQDMQPAPEDNRIPDIIPFTSTPSQVLPGPYGSAGTTDTNTTSLASEDEEKEGNKTALLHHAAERIRPIAPEIKYAESLSPPPSAIADKAVITASLFDSRSLTAPEPAVVFGSPAATERGFSYPVEISIENITSGYKAPKKRVFWQLFVTPTISYRKLSENKSYEMPAPVDPGSSPNTPFTLPHDVNSAVTHKPDMGLQIGFSGRYPVSRRVNIRGGVQFNINRYDIKAFRYNGELATINLNGNGTNTGTVATWTYYRNQDGYKSDWLKNYYFSVSAPIGAEFRIAGNQKTSLGVAGTIQPTYIIRDRAYLLSTDYKNYAEVPWLIRRANINTGFEAFVNYTSRSGVKWQVGPQVRYQVLSSFQNRYPVKENLFDFGMKIGVTLNE